MEFSARVPRHVAIVMDGNGRWAESRGYPRTYGHIHGARRVKAIVRAASELGIKALTLYAFSTENWSRPSGEVGVIWRLFRKYLIRETAELNRQNVRLRILGEVERLGPEVQEVLQPALNKLAGNTGLQLSFAISYGGRRELALASRRFAEDCVAGRRKPEEMNEALLSSYLWTGDLGDLADVDLVIRTSGEQRTSNFLLWQAAYAEYYFPTLCWPDFTPKDLQQAIEEYGRRERRFGGLKAGGLMKGAGKV